MLAAFTSFRARPLPIANERSGEPRSDEERKEGQDLYRDPDRIRPCFTSIPAYLLIDDLVVGLVRLNSREKFTLLGIGTCVGAVGQGA